MKDEEKFYIAKDKDGRVYLYGPALDKRGEFHEPVLSKDDTNENIWFTNTDNCGSMRVPSCMFPELSWEDEEPTLVGLARGDYRENILSTLKNIKENEELLSDEDIRKELLGIFETACGIKMK